MRILSHHDVTLVLLSLLPAVLCAWGLIALAASGARGARRPGGAQEQHGMAPQHASSREVATISDRVPEDGELVPAGR